MLDTRTVTVGPQRNIWVQMALQLGEHWRSITTRTVRKSKRFEDVKIMVMLFLRYTLNFYPICVYLSLNILLLVDSANPSYPWSAQHRYESHSVSHTTDGEQSAPLCTLQQSNRDHPRCSPFANLSGLLTGPFSAHYFPCTASLLFSLSFLDLQPQFFSVDLTITYDHTISKPLFGVNSYFC